MKNIFIAFIILIFSSSIACAMPTEMVKTETGKVYYLGFIKVYEASLYVYPKTSLKNILESDVSKCLSLDYATAIEKEDLIKSADVVLDNQIGRDGIQGISQQLLLLNQNYEDIVEGDNYTLCYDGEEEETTLIFNSKEIVKIISQEFAHAYFGIWLGSKDPIDRKLRDKLLRRST